MQDTHSTQFFPNPWWLGIGYGAWSLETRLAKMCCSQVGMLSRANWQIASNTFFVLVKLVFAQVRDNELIRVNEVVQKCKDAGFLQASCVTLPETRPGLECLMARCFIIAAFGWTTMLCAIHLGPKLNLSMLNKHKHTLSRSNSKIRRRDSCWRF